jgi:hypothetical protein
MSVDAVSGRYNVVLADEYETFEYQIPVQQFIKELEDRGTFDEVCVVNLGEAFERGEASRLSRAMQDRAPDFDPRATIQFAVEGSIQSVRGGFELLYQDDFYRLDKVFGANLSEHEEGWLTATF